MLKNTFHFRNLHLHTLIFINPAWPWRICVRWNSLSPSRCPTKEMFRCSQFWGHQIGGHYLNSFCQNLRGMDIGDISCPRVPKKRRDALDQILQRLFEDADTRSIGRPCQLLICWSGQWALLPIRINSYHRWSWRESNGKSQKHVGHEVCGGNVHQYYIWEDWHWPPTDLHIFLRWFRHKLPPRSALTCGHWHCIDLYNPYLYVYYLSPLPETVQPEAVKYSEMRAGATQSVRQTSGFAVLVLSGLSAVPSCHQSSGLYCRLHIGNRPMNPIESINS